MRQRPLCIVFLALVIFIFAAKASGFSLWGEPEENLRRYAEEISGTDRVIYGVVAAREEKTNSISYFLKDTYLIQNTSFKEADIASVKKDTPVSLHNINLYLSKDESLITVGSEIIVFGEPEVYKNAGNPGGFDAAYYYAADDCCMSVYAEDIKVISEPGFSVGEAFALLKEKLRHNLNALMDDEPAAALSAMLFGVRTDITGEMKLDYSASGLSHILAISGMHVAIIGGALYRLFIFLRFNIKAASFAAIALAAVYCVFTGSSESTVRAVIMFAAMHMSKCVLRTYDQMSALSLAGIIMLAVNPMSLFRAGFQLSFAAVAGMACLMPLIKKKIFKKEGISKSAKLLRRWVTEPAVLWLSVNLMTFPIVLYHFSEFPVYSLVTNILFVPLVSIVMITGMAGAALSLFVPAAADLILFIPEIILNMQNKAGEVALELPNAMLILGKPLWWQIVLSYAGITVLALMLKKRKTGSPAVGFGRSVFKAAPELCAVILACVSLVHLPEGFSVTALDVGQGDCIFIRDKNYVYMVDGGSSSESSVGRYSILPYIKSQGISTVEGIFLTHADTDHMNGVEELLGMILERKTGITVKYLFMPYWLADTNDGKNIAALAKKAGIAVRPLNNGDGIGFGGTDICVLNPETGDGLTDNAGSLVMSVEHGGFKALLTGDIEGEGEERLLGSLGGYDCLKVAHHGSRNSGSEGFYNEVKPSVCIISAPKKSVYGHPHAETIKRIEDAGADWYQTGISGAVRVESDGSAMTVETYR